MNEPQLCQLCSQPAPAGRMYCSDDHMGQAQRSAVDKTSALAVFLDKELRRRRMTIEALARELGIGGSTLTRWIHGYWRDGKRVSCLPKQPNWDRLREYFGDELPKLTNATELLRERSRAWATEGLQRPAVRRKREAERRKVAKAQRGMKRPGITKANLEWHRRRREAGEHWNPNPDFASLATSARGRAQRAVGAYLSRYPGTSAEELKQHISELADREGVPAGLVWWWGTKQLKDHGVKVTGHPSDEVRHEQAAPLLAQWDASTAADQRARGSKWQWVARCLSLDPLDDDWARREANRHKAWWNAHLPRCERGPSSVTVGRSDAETAGLVTVRAAATQLGRSPTTIKRMVLDGRLPRTRKIRGTLRIHPGDLANLGRSSSAS